MRNLDPIYEPLAVSGVVAPKLLEPLQKHLQTEDHQEMKVEASQRPVEISSQLQR